MDYRIGPVSYEKQAAMAEELNIHHSSHDPSTNRAVIAVVGCGGIGFWLALHAAMIGYDKFVLFDNDIIEATNLNRLPLNQCWINKSKVTALKALLRSLRPDIMVMAIKRHMNPAIDLDLFKHDPLNRYKTLLFDCTDNAHTQKAIFEATNQQTHIRYEKIGYEGFKVGSYSDYQAWIPDNYQPGYRTSVANSLSSSFAAIIGLLKVLMDHREDCNINILKLIKGETDAESKRVAQ